MTLYETYVKKYNNAVKYNKENRLPNIITDKYNKNEFKAFYEQTRVTLLEQGKSASVNQVIKEMVDRQQFSASKEEGKALIKAMEMRGYNITLDEARAFKGYFAEGAEDSFNALPQFVKNKAIQVKNFFDEIKAEYRRLIANGISGGQAKKLISNIYFGSV